MNTLDKLLARIHAAELAAKVRPRRTHHEHHEDDDHRGARSRRPRSAHHPKRTTTQRPKHQKGDRR
jgi:hypothetical protein